jgi:hypothetical protein
MNLDISEIISRLSDALWLVLAIEFLFFSFLLITFWRIFEKSGINPLWALVPLVNLFYLVKISRICCAFFWFILMLLPIINFIAWFIISIKISHNFDKTILYGIFLWMFPFLFLPHLALSKSVYLSHSNKL